jgi:hypothetical protein
MDNNCGNFIEGFIGDIVKKSTAPISDDGTNKSITITSSTGNLFSHLSKGRRFNTDGAEVGTRPCLPYRRPLAGIGEHPVLGCLIPKKLKTYRQSHLLAFTQSERAMFRLLT